MLNPTVYLAGPMRGYEDHNFPRFHEAAEALRAKGYEVVSPAELDEATYEHANGIELSTKEYMKRDLPLMLDCDGVVLLEGYTGSTGALCEFYVATMCKVPTTFITNALESKEWLYAYADRR